MSDMDLYLYMLLFGAVQPTTARHLWPWTAPHPGCFHQGKQDFTLWEGDSGLLQKWPRFDVSVFHSSSMFNRHFLAKVLCDYSQAEINVSLSFCFVRFVQHLFNSAAFKARTKQRNKVRDKRADVMWEKERRRERSRWTRLWAVLTRIHDALDSSPVRNTQTQQKGLFNAIELSIFQDKWLISSVNVKD